MSVRILCDSASDITQEQAKEWGITVLPLKILWNQEEYQDGITMKPEEFYEKLVTAKELPTTSQLTPYEFEEVFRQVVDEGDTAVCLTISSKLSGTFQSANIAKEEFGEKIMVVDTLNATFGEHILVKRAIELRDSGMSAVEIADTLNREKEKITLVALVDTLEYLKKGGRVSSAVAIAGAVLNIKPVLAIVEGEIISLGKARGTKNGNHKLIEVIEKEGIDFSRPFAFSYAGLKDDLLKKFMEDSRFLYDGNTKDFSIVQMGSVIGTHVGPNAFGIAFFKK